MTSVPAETKVKHEYNGDSRECLVVHFEDSDRIKLDIKAACLTSLRELNA